MRRYDTNRWRTQVYFENSRSLDIVWKLFQQDKFEVFEGTTFLGIPWTNTRSKKLRDLIWWMLIFLRILNINWPSATLIPEVFFVLSASEATCDRRLQLNEKGKRESLWNQARLGPDKSTIQYKCTATRLLWEKLNGQQAMKWWFLLPETVFMSCFLGIYFTSF